MEGAETAGDEEIYSTSFNQDNGCFIVSTSRGIRVFNTHEFQSTFFRGKHSNQYSKQKAYRMKLCTKT